MIKHVDSLVKLTRLFKFVNNGRAESENRVKEKRWFENKLGKRRRDSVAVRRKEAIKESKRKAFLFKSS